MDATIYIQFDEKFPDGSTVSVIVWQLPHPTIERPHGYKYRLNYWSEDGITLVRYDNKTGKGDHKHLGNLQIPYSFVNTDKLVDDFWEDVTRARIR